jgi:hypothetical protein
MREQWGMLEVRDFDLRTATQFFTTAQNIIDVFEEVVEYLDGEENDKKADEEAKEAKKALRKACEYQFHSDKLRVEYEVDVTDMDDADEEDEEEKEEKPKVILTICAQILKVDDQTHCVDFSLKKYKINGEESDAPSWEMRDKFLRHYHSLIKIEPIKNYIDASLSTI